jgi:hypothetical protein
MGAYSDRVEDRAPVRVGQQTAGGLGPIIGRAGEGSAGRGPSGSDRGIGRMAIIGTFRHS